MFKVAFEEVLSRFGALSDADVDEKGPGDLVTVADRRAEERLTQGLTALLPGSHVVGEEAVSADKSVLRHLKGDDPVWIVDPVDGTGNFVRGSERFCMLVALARAGEVVASWTYAPALGILATARLGGGALCDGKRIRVDATGASTPARPRLALTHPTYLSDDHRERLTPLRTDDFDVEESTSAGLEYVDLARGEIDALVYTWEYPWDHAAGLLLVKEAGGVARTMKGTPFALAGNNALPLIVAGNPKLADKLSERVGKQGASA